MWRFLVCLCLLGAVPFAVSAQTFTPPGALPGLLPKLPPLATSTGASVAPVPFTADTVPRSRILKRGMRGADVATLQTQLIHLGLLEADDATGFFGSRTEAAVKAFQKKNGIASGGTAATTGYGAFGPRTRGMLSVVANDISSARNQPATTDTGGAGRPTTDQAASRGDESGLPDWRSYFSGTTGTGSSWPTSVSAGTGGVASGGSSHQSSNMAAQTVSDTSDSGVSQAGSGVYGRVSLQVGAGETVRLDPGTKSYTVTLKPSSRNAPITITSGGGAIVPLVKVTDIASWEDVPGTSLIRAKTGAHVQQLFDGTPLARMPVAKSRPAAGSKYSRYMSLSNSPTPGGQSGILYVNPADTALMRSDGGNIISGMSAFAVIRTDNWRFVRRQVNAVDWQNGTLGLLGGSVTSAETGAAPEHTNGYFLAHTAPRKPGEWAYSDGYLYYYPLNAKSRANGTVHISLLEGNGPDELQNAGVNIDLVGFTGDLIVKDITSIGASGDGVAIRSAGRVTISNVNASLSAENGIYVSAPNISISDSTSMDSQTSGVAAVGAVLDIRRSKFYRNGILGTQGAPDQALAGIHAAVSQKAEFASNDIRASGGAGIFLSQPDARLVVEGNYVEDSCRVTNDCGAIYISSNYVVPVANAEYRISGNQIYTVTGDFDGVTGYYAQKMRAGIYLDFSASGFSIFGNTISGASAPGELLSDVYGLGRNSVDQPSNTVKMGN